MLENQFKGGAKHFNELLFYFLGVSIESAKGNGWKGALFIIPVVIAILSIIFWIIKIVV